MKQILSLPITRCVIFLMLLAVSQNLISSEQESNKKYPPEDSLSAGGYTYHSVRGIEQDETQASYRMRRLADGLLFLPRTLIDLLLRSAGYGAVLIDEKNLVEAFEDVFYIYHRRLGWFPLLNLVTGSPKGYGLGFFYRHQYLNGQLKTIYRDPDIWAVKAKISYIFFKRKYLWQIQLGGRIQNDDNYEFYGIGSNPRNDPRSHFRPGTENEFGLYALRRILLDATLGVRTSPNLEFLYTFYYQRRTIRNPSGARPDYITNVFDAARLPGFLVISKKIYNELAVRYDNRANLALTAPGVRWESYIGLSNGLKNDNERLLRAGSDIMAFIPILKDNRLFTPRIAFDMVEDVNRKQEIVFTEYPRHLAFRGITSKALLRSDNYLLFSSLEYQWPLTYNLNGDIFLDRIMVADAPGKFTFKNSPWALGFGINLHTRRNELLRTFISYGSQGVFFRLRIGVASRFRDRTDWR